MGFSLQPASAIVGDFLQCTFRGVPFAVSGSSGQVGRRVATHDYPGHDGVWSEDLGRQGRRWQITGLLVGPQCYTIRDLLQNAVERKGPGLLIHPSLGILNVCCVNFEFSERSGFTNVIDLKLGFVEQKELLSSLITAGLHALIAGASMALRDVSAAGFVSVGKGLFNHGSSVAASSRAVALVWGRGLLSSATRPQSVGQASGTIAGNNGRYLGDGGTLSAAEALDDLAGYRAGLSDSLSGLSAAASPQAMADAVATVASQYTAGITDPAVQIGLLTPHVTVPVALLSPVTQQASVLSEAEAAIQPWTQLLCLLSLVGALAEALSDWQPDTSAQARESLNWAANLFDQLQTVAGNNNLDDLYQALATLAAHTLSDLGQKSASLPDLITIQRGRPIPALALAQQLYGDGSRGDELAAKANASHPAFMPLIFEAKSA